MKKIRALGVILPQFHPIPENDKWWGKGFTEWINVAKAKPRFKGHYQPHLPADLGFYDLRLEQTRIDQAELAKKYDIYGFCIYHYWFNGKRLLNNPVDGMLASGKPDFPFMLCWANENWTRRWDGQDKEILIKQDYSPEDHREHAKWLCENVFKDPRYILVYGKPFFLFFNTHIIPDLKETIKIWRDEVKKHGFEDIYLGGVRNTINAFKNPEEFGFDVIIEWQPEWSNLNDQMSFYNKLKQKFQFGSSFRKVDYSEVARRMLNKKPSDFKHFDAIFPNWDNTARRKHNAFIVDNSTPEKYGEWLNSICERFEPPSEQENFLFINAMNEWAEGNHLEPDQKYGLTYLEETKKVLDKYK